MSSVGDDLFPERGGKPAPEPPHTRGRRLLNLGVEPCEVGAATHAREEEASWRVRSDCMRMGRGCEHRA